MRISAHVERKTRTDPNMSELITNEPEGDAAFDLGEMLGSRRAFSAIAGRCSAADAACLRRIREEKLFITRAATWDEFCPKFLGMSRANANRAIGYLEEFGPDYFELAQLTRITPAEFRAIAGQVKDKTIHWQGDAIALIPENSEKVAAAVDALRKAAGSPAKKQQSRPQRIATLSRACGQVAAEFADLARDRLSYREKPSLWAVRAELLKQLRDLDLQG